MVSSEEQNLTDTLVDPENLDNPSSYTKGEVQPTRCRDAWAALLFYGQFIAIAVVAGVLGVPAVQKATNGDDNSFQNGFNSSDSPDLGESTNIVSNSYDLRSKLFILLKVLPPNASIVSRSDNLAILIFLKLFLFIDKCR